MPSPLPRLIAAAALCALIAVPLAPASGDAPSCCPDLSGSWSGSWQSATTGHKGRLCAKLTRCGPGHYRCTFCGTFLKVVPFRYTVTLHVTGCEHGRVCFRASRRLPLCGGTFTCTGSATARCFHGSFSSADDRGTFTLSR